MFLILMMMNNVFIPRKSVKLNLILFFWRENKIIIKMQTRSQTRKLLIDPKNEMFEIPIVRLTEKATVKTPTEKATERPKTTKVSARVLPDSIINGPTTPINCALYLPKYIQKPLYEVDIDFDEASEAWRSNKTSIGNGQYKYNKGTRRSLKIPY